jgi:tetratricopeptide (TPR) repeat protein
MSRTRVLRPTTIIPPPLYVDRNADRQLDAIVEDMGRPGYILVARQMGKTNLLLAMKRRRTARGDVVLYLDLSVRFGTPRSLFRHIIDSLIDSANGALDQYTAPISALRNNNAEPNVEYDRSLRFLLRAESSTRFIIILDEIDSLVNVTYSDAVLSQVRSMYFSRGSFPEYYRLTYALSGVIEPSNLIKDKNISPFNIGEKILLNDFSSSEVDLFVRRAGLSLSSASIERLYLWTGGNPRMTWDVCAALEESANEGLEIEADAVEEAVRSLYLTSFDRAPVDHIRHLAASDRELRDAIVAIRYGKSGALSDALRSKLYLAGITSGEDASVLNIKNRVIDAALSESWMAQVSERGSELAASAERYYRSKRYQDAIRAYTDFVRDRPDAGALPTSHRLNLALSRYFTADFDGAVADLKGIKRDTDDQQDSALIEFYIGRTLLEAGEYSDAITHFLVAQSGEGSVSLDATLGVAAAMLKEGSSSNLDEVVKACGDIALRAEHSFGEARSGSVAEAHLMLALALWKRGNWLSAQEHISAAATYGPSTLTPHIMLLRIDMARSRADRVHLAEQLSGLIKDYGAGLESDTLSYFNVTEREIGLTAAHLEKYGRVSALDSFIDHLRESLPAPRPSSRAAVLLRLYRSAHDEDAKRIMAPLLKAITGRYAKEDASGGVVMEALRRLWSDAPEHGRRAGAEQYLREFKQRMTPSLLTPEDIALFTAHAASSYSSGDLVTAHRLIDLLGPFHEVALEIEPVWYVVFLNIQMHVFDLRGHPERAESKAREIIQVLEHGKVDRDGLGTEAASLFDGFLKAARKRLEQPRVREIPIKIGRNVRVRVRSANGDREFLTKYKYVEADVSDLYFERALR